MKTFDKKFLVDELDLPYNDDIVVLNETVDTSRWSIQYELIFKHEEKFYRTYYQVGATESQWEYDDTVKCEEVHQVEKLVKVWEPVK